MADDDSLRADLPIEPYEEDLITDDYRTFWRYEMNDRNWVVFSPEGGDWAKDVRAYMDFQQFWPNVWFLGERGDWNLLDIETGRFAEYNKET